MSKFIRVCCGRKELAKVIAEDLTTAAIADLVSQLDGVAGKLAFDIRGLPWCSDDVRWCLLSAIVNLKDRAMFRHGNHRWDRLFPAAHDAMVDTADIAAHAAGIRGAIEAAALTCPSAATEAAGEIHKRIKFHGGKPPAVSKIAKEIDALGGTTDPNTEESGDTPTLLAEQFLTKMEREAHADMPIRYFRGDFWRWTGKAWQMLEQDSLRCELT